MGCTGSLEDLIYVSVNHQLGKKYDMLSGTITVEHCNAQLAHSIQNEKILVSGTRVNVVACFGGVHLCASLGLFHCV